jgi:hypothetical protein
MPKLCTRYKLVKKLSSGRQNKGMYKGTKGLLVTSVRLSSAFSLSLYVYTYACIGSVTFFSHSSADNSITMIRYFAHVLGTIIQSSRQYRRLGWIGRGWGTRANSRGHLVQPSSCRIAGVYSRAQ